MRAAHIVAKTMVLMVVSEVERVRPNAVTTPRRIEIEAMTWCAPFVESRCMIDTARNLLRGMLARAPFVEHATEAEDGSRCRAIHE